MGGRSRSNSSAFACILLIPCLAIQLLCMISPCSGARPLPAQISKAPASMEINHRKYDEHDEHNQQTNESLHQKLQLDLLPFNVMGKSWASKPVFTMLPKGPVPPSGPSPITNSSPNAESTQISTSSVTDQP